MKRKFVMILTAIVVMFGAIPGRADVTVPNCFTDNGVFQRDKPICVWGWADPSEEVAVTFNGITVTTTACDKGMWKVELPAEPASYEAKDLVIQGNNTLKFSNILVGEVWICGGQSNMEMPLNSWGQKLRGTDTPRLACTEEELTGDYSYIRFNRAKHIVSDEPKNSESPSAECP